MHHLKLNNMKIIKKSKSKKTDIESFYSRAAICIRILDRGLKKYVNYNTDNNIR